MVAQERTGQPVVNLDEIGPIDQRSLPGAGRLEVAARGRKRGGEIRERGGAVGIRIDRLLERRLGFDPVARRKRGEPAIELRLRPVVDSRQERGER